MARDRRERELRRQEKARNKKPLGERIGNHLGNQARAIGELGDVIVNRPSTLHTEAHGWFRRWFAKVWRVRGGGLYAFGFAVTFTIYEIRMVLEDLSNG